jgi:hypothetical protein
MLYVTKAYLYNADSFWLSNCTLGTSTRMLKLNNKAYPKTTQSGLYIHNLFP